MEESEGQGNKEPCWSKKHKTQSNDTDVVLDITGRENSEALHRIQGVVGDGEPRILEESEPVPPKALLRYGAMWLRR